MARAHRWWGMFTIVALAAVLAASCDSSPEPEREGDGSERGASTTAAEARTAPVGVATDQPCTETATLEKGVRDVPYRNDFLEAMVLAQEDLGVPGSFDVDYLNSGYLDNKELTELYPVGCDDLAETGRITGYSASYQAFEEPHRSVLTAVHLFFTPEGASRWVEAVVAGFRRLTEVPDSGVNSVEVRPLDGVDRAGVLVDVVGESGSQAWAVFSDGDVAAWVRDDREGDAAATIDVTAVAARLDAQIRDLRARAADRIGAGDGITRLMSVPVPLSGWGSRYEGLVWDWFFGGCIDARERATYSTANEERRAEEIEEADRFGRLGECGAMYSPAEPAVSDEVVRIITWATLYADEQGAKGDFADSIAERERTLGASPEEGLTRGPVERFDVPELGDESVGTRQQIEEEAGGFTDTRVTFRKGRLVLSVILHERTGRDATSEVVAVGEKLEARAHDLLG